METSERLLINQALNMDLSTSECKINIDSIHKQITSLSSRETYSSITTFPNKM